jgi:hypothetical protein
VQVATGRERLLADRTNIASFVISRRGSARHFGEGEADRRGSYMRYGMYCFGVKNKGQLFPSDGRAGKWFSRGCGCRNKIQACASALCDV